MSFAISESVNKPLWFFIVLLPFLTFISKASGDIYLSLTAIFFIVYSIKHKNFEYLQWGWVKAIFVFWLFAMVSAWFTPFPKDAFIQSLIYIRWPLAAMALVFYVFNQSERLLLFEKAAAVFLFFIVMDGILQMVTGTDILGHPIIEGSRMTGFFSKRVLGVYSFKLFFFYFLVVYISIPKTIRNIFIMTLIIVLFDIFLLFTGERIVFLLGVFFLIFWSVTIFLTVPSLRKLLYVSLLTVLVLFTVLIIFNHAILVKRAMPFIEALKNFSSTTYSDIFNSAYQLWQTSPLVGVGTRMYNEVCVAKLGYPEDEALFEQVSGLCVRHPHNIYLELLAQNGILGLILFMVVLYSIFRIIAAKQLWKIDPLLTTIISGSVIVIFWPLASSMSIFANNYAGAVWLTIAWAIARSRIMLIHNTHSEGKK
ncbi:MAG TPA: O-antigen ligase family protein [Agitococcus sp.]|nr:O-antigen ligase family protein [Agitococcus sp.]HMV60448.1 O-antigen ligase family protein [Agitococcus sp.]HMX99629.1 O-antigen ligase family protein [Agitococcus sp.]HNJ85176.1 O-antigen ligase family protein [Agitococcus sp.]